MDPEQHPTTPQPLDAAPPPYIMPTSMITTQQVPFTSTYVVQVDGISVAIDGKQVFASEAEAKEAARTLRPVS